MLSVVIFVTGFYSGKTFGFSYGEMNDSILQNDSKAMNTGTIPTNNTIQSDIYINEEHVDTEKGRQSVISDILLINYENPLSRDYQPEELINLYEQRNRHFQLARSDIRICRTVFEAMDSMFSAAQADGVDGFIITSGYRSFIQQSEIYKSRSDGMAAAPGTSEHETGLAFDVVAMGNENFALTPQYEWLSQNCGEFGFILRYPESKECITGTPYEPWHYRYVGLPHSVTIMEEGITLEEYLTNLS